MTPRPTGTTSSSKPEHAGGDDWTTLPGSNGHTVTAPGASCTASTAGGWMSLHPQLLHYVTRNEADATCTSTGTTGEWNAASGSSGGWQEWSVDLSEWAGGTGRGVDHVRERLVDPEPRRVRRRRHLA